MSDERLHKRLDAEYTQALLQDCSGDYKAWLEERVEELETEVKVLRRGLRGVLCDCDEPSLPANTHMFSCLYRAFLREHHLRGDTALQWEDE